MPLHPTLARVTDRIRARSAASRSLYLDRMGKAAKAGPADGQFRIETDAAYDGVGAAGAVLMLVALTLAARARGRGSAGLSAAASEPRAARIP